MINGHLVQGDTIDLVPGDNAVRITQRFDSGVLDGSIRTKTVDGAPAFDSHGAWIDRAESVVVLDETAQAISDVVPAPQGTFRVDKQPGRYIAIAATNEEITWWWILPQLKDHQFLAALEEFGTRFQIEPGQTTTLRLADHTIDFQDLAAKFGLDMYRR